MTMTKLEEAHEIDTNGGIIPIFCMVCGDPLDEKHARKKGVMTCNKEKSDCSKLLRERRRRITHTQRKKCRSCGAPYGPKEVEAFKAWRKTLGVKRGRPAKVKPEEVAQVESTEAANG